MFASSPVPQSKIFFWGASIVCTWVQFLWTAQKKKKTERNAFKARMPSEERDRVWGLGRRDVYFRHNYKFYWDSNGLRSNLDTIITYFNDARELRRGMETIRAELRGIITPWGRL